jgi:translocation and assembly module TamA
MLATDRRINLFSLNILAALLLAPATTCSAAAEREKSPEAGAGAIEYADIGSVHKDGELVTEPRHASQVVRRIWMNIRTSEDRQSFKESIARMQNRKPVYLSYTVTADQSDIEDNIRAYLNTLSKIRRRGFVFHKKEIEKKVAEAMAVFGYYNPEITIELADQSDNANGEVLIKARKGKPVLIRNIEADLNVDDEVLALLEKVRLLNHMVKDGIFNHSDYESYKSSLIANAVSKGYLKAKLVSSRVKLYPEENAADIFITFDGGPRYKISRIEFHGFEESHDMARKLTPIKEGEYYDTEKISKMNHNLYESGYFKTADIQTKKDDIVDDQVPLKVELARRPYATLDAGIGVSTDEGVRLQLFGKMPWLNSKGHSFNSFMKVSQVNQYIHGDYIIPRNDPLRDFYVISPHFEHKDNNDTLYDSVVMTLAYVTKTHGRWERKYFLEYGYDDFEQGGEHGNASLLMPGVQLSTSDMEENTMDPSWGYRFTVTGKTSVEQMISNQSLAHVNASMKWVLSPTENSRLVMRYEQGWLFGGDMKKIPPRLRFFAGGDQSIRGYGFEKIAPKNNKGELLGGRYLSVGSVEMQFPIRTGMRLATFLDAGTVNNSYIHPDMHYGTGLGVRYISPVGPIRFDIGVGVSETHVPWKIHFGIGPEL